MNVRLAKREDRPVLRRLFAETVRAINATDYSAEQVEAWASVPVDLEGCPDRLGSRSVFVAELGCEILGFTTFDTDGHLDHLYVHHRFQKHGVASALLLKIEEEAVSRGINRIFTDASITARPFFENVGFRLINQRTVVVN
jgi:putative acetyltransferase